MSDVDLPGWPAPGSQTMMRRRFGRVIGITSVVGLAAIPWAGQLYRLRRRAPDRRMMKTVGEAEYAQAQRHPPTASLARLYIATR